MNYKGVIIEESLENTDILDDVRILSTKVERVMKEHNTPWLKQWTLHTVKIPEDRADFVADEISKVLDPSHGGSWYADFKNNKTHFVIFRDKVFKVERGNKEQYDEAVRFGTALGIPDHQLDFSPDIKEWER